MEEDTIKKKDFEKLNYETFFNKGKIKPSDKEFNDSNYLIVKRFVESKDYYKININNQEQLQKCFINDMNYFEVMFKNQYKKIFIDLDFKDEKCINKYITYNEIVKLANDFMKYLKTEYKSLRDKKIKSYIQISTEKNKINKRETKITSCHIYFNVYHDNKDTIKKIILKFIQSNNNNKYNENIDLKVYRQFGLFRAINQSKEERNDTLRFFEGLNNKNITKEHFITTITDTDILFNEEVNFIIETDKIFKNEIHNCNCNINIKQDNILYDYISSLHYNDYDLNWFYNLRIVINVLKQAGYNDFEIENHICMDLFLKQSLQVEKYKNSDKNNKILLREKLIEQNKSDFNLLYFKTLDYKKRVLIRFVNDNVIKYIYDKLELDKSTNTTITNKKINQKYYLDIEIKNSEKNNLFDLQTNTLLADVKLFRNENKNIEFIIVNQFNMILDYFNNSTEQIKYFKNIENHKYINNWKEANNNYNESCYFEGACGSRKTSLRMKQDLKNCLDNLHDNKTILFIGDTTTLLNQLIQDLKTEYEMYSDIIINTYKDTDEQKKTIPHIYITSYQSLIKTPNNYIIKHVFIDEFINVRKNILFNEDNANKKYKTNNLMYRFFYYLNSCISLKLYDADLKQEDINTITKYTNKTINYFTLTKYTQYNNKIKITNNKKAIHEIYKHIDNNEPITISTTSQSHGEKLFDNLLLYNPNIKIVFLYGENKIRKGGATDNTHDNSKDLKNQLTEHTDLWLNYDIVIYTPTITCGISQNSKDYFYKHYSFVSFIKPQADDIKLNGVDIEQIAQQIFRTRHLIKREIIICDTNNNYSTLLDKRLLDIKNTELYSKNRTNIFKENILELQNNAEHSDLLNKMFKQIKNNLKDCLSTNDYNNYETDTHNKNILEQKIKLFNNDLTLTHFKVNRLNDIEDYCKLYYKLIEKLKKWGCNQFIFDIHNTYIETIKLNKHISDKISISTLQQASYTNFYNTEYRRIDLKNTIELSTEQHLIFNKYRLLKSLNITQENYNNNKNKLNYQDLLFSFLKGNTLIKYFKKIELLTLINYKKLIKYNIEDLIQKNTNHKKTKKLILLYSIFKIVGNKNYNIFLNHILNDGIPNENIQINKKEQIEIAVEKLLNKYKKFFKDNYNKTFKTTLEYVEYVCEYFLNIIRYDNAYLFINNNGITIPFQNNFTKNKLQTYISKSFIVIDYDYLPSINLLTITKNNIKNKYYFNKSYITELLIRDKIPIELYKSKNILQPITEQEIIKKIPNNITLTEATEYTLLENEIVKPTEHYDNDNNNIIISNLGNCLFLKENLYFNCQIAKVDTPKSIKQNEIKDYRILNSNIPRINDTITRTYLIINSKLYDIDILVCRLYLNNYINTYYILHKNNNYENNAVDNLEQTDKWIIANYDKYINLQKQHDKNKKKQDKINIALQKKQEQEQKKQQQALKKQEQEQKKQQQAQKKQEREIKKQEQEQKKQDKINKKNQVLKCEICDIIFTTQRNLTRHNKNKH